jgi:hypothetical protein
MTGRERVQRAMHYQSVDKAPLQYYYTPVGYYEHGDKLNDLYATLPGDFEPFVRMPIKGPAPEEIDESGRYHAVHTDDWGIPWEYRIFGITGIPLKHIIEDDDQKRIPEDELQRRLSPPGFCQHNHQCKSIHQEQNESHRTVQRHARS